MLGNGGGRPVLPFSVVAQMDALVFSLLGVRLERDVLASPGDASFFRFGGWKRWESLSSFCGFYMGALEAMPRVVALMISHLACGLVVVPPLGSAPLPQLVLPKGRRCTWVEWLDGCDTKLLEFGLPGGMRAIFVSAGSSWKFKKKRRSEKLFKVEVVDLLDAQPNPVVGVTPVSLTRSSPEPALGTPLPSQDTCPDDGPLSELPDVRPPDPPHKWDVPLFRSWSLDFPDPVVRRIAVESVGRGLDPGFVGVADKSVVRPNSKTIVGREEELRDELMDECNAGRIAGPYARPPFRFCRTTPLKMIKKKKHDPSSDLMRIISNFSSGRSFAGEDSAAINDLCFSPCLIGLHLRPYHIRDQIAWKGPGVTGWAADVPKCFRRQRNLRRLLHLFVYHLETTTHGLEWFIELCNPFGWKPSEYSWQCILAVLMWYFRKNGILELLAYVDNFFRFFGPGEEPGWEVEFIESSLFSVGLDLHEVQSGTSIKGLGWRWDLREMRMECLPDKFAVFSDLLREWSSRSPLRMSLPEVRAAVGFMVWLSAAFHAGVAGVAALVGTRTRLDDVARRKKLSAEAVSQVLTGEAAETLLFWSEFFPKWDGSCPIFLGFTPVSTWEVLGQCDASTEWGCGGVLYDGEQTLLGFAREWTEDERRRAFVSDRESTGVLELLGAAEWMSKFGSFCEGKRVQLEMDNVSAVHALVKLFSPKPEMMVSVRRVRALMVSLNACVRVLHVRARFNALADLLSHNRLGDARCLAEEWFGVELQLL